jgi:hypothetical protein
MAMSDTDDSFDDDPEFQEFAKDFDRHRRAIHERISDYMDETELAEGIVAQLLIEAMINMRMADYGMSVEHPSVAGLKLDLDRLRREVEECVREAKKGAPEYIDRVKEARAIAEAEEAEEGEGADQNGMIGKDAGKAHDDH